MIGHRRTYVGAVLIVFGSGLLLAPPAQAGAVHELRALSVTPSAVTVSGFSSVPVTITADVRADDVIGACPSEPTAFGGGLAAMMRHVGPAAFGVMRSWLVPLHRVSGTDAVGTWSGTWDLAATDGGTWLVDRVIGCTQAGSMGQEVVFDVRPADVGLTGIVVATASKVPTLTMTRTPAIAPYGRSQLIRWTFRNGNGTRLAGRRIKVGTDVGCGFYWWGDRVATLDANGSFAVYRSATNAGGTGDRCVILTTRPDGTGALMLTDRSLNRWYFRSVTARLSRATVRYGASASVSGAISPYSGPAATTPLAGLQRYEHGSWRGVALSALAGGGTYSLPVRPPTRGRWWFRVVAVPRSGNPELALTPTRAFSVTAV